VVVGAYHVACLAGVAYLAVVAYHVEVAYLAVVAYHVEVACQAVVAWFVEVACHDEVAYPAGACLAEVACQAEVACLAVVAHQIEPAFRTAVADQTVEAACSSDLKRWEAADPFVEVACQRTDGQGYWSQVDGNWKDRIDPRDASVETAVRMRPRLEGHRPAMAEIWSSHPCYRKDSG
jgi:hypothetical protein